MQPFPLSITTERTPAATLLRLVGEIDLSSAHLMVDSIDDAAFDRLGLLKIKSEASLKHIGELAAANRDVTRKERTRSLDDIYVHRRSAYIKERHDLIVRRVVVDFVAVLKSKSVNVDHNRCFSCQLDRLFDIVDALAFAGCDQNMGRVRRFGGHLIIEADIGEIIWNMLVGVPVYRFF